METERQRMNRWLEGVKKAKTVWFEKYKAMRTERDALRAQLLVATDALRLIEQAPYAKTAAEMADEALAEIKWLAMEAK